MNEQRLTEFGEQALEYAHANYIAGSDPHQWNVLYRKKFAELIVDECCLKLLDMDEKTKGNHNYYKHAALEVKKHFGVEL